MGTFLISQGHHLPSTSTEMRNVPISQYCSRIDRKWKAMAQ